MSGRLAVIGGYAEGLGAGVAESLRARGWTVVGLSRRGGGGMSVDLLDADAVGACLREVEAAHGPVTAYLHHAHALVRGSVSSLVPGDYEHAWRTSVLTAVHVIRALVPGFVAREEGALIFLGATASVRGGAGFSAFASAKFALRGLAQALARELGPQGVHVLHLILDGLIQGPQTTERFGAGSGRIEPAEVGTLLGQLLDQSPRAWVHELDVRTAGERW
ncbi:MAG: SDR family NAD(P)-dependent oxidoreductase [Myxococcales bacterium]|nr:SDR family NAD(P)-dependent oxidoreductase [Myxococcales bacterium]